MHRSIPWDMSRPISHQTALPTLHSRGQPIRTAAKAQHHRNTAQHSTAQHSCMSHVSPPCLSTESPSAHYFPWSGPGVCKWERVGGCTGVLNSGRKVVANRPGCQFPVSSVMRVF